MDARVASSGASLLPSISPFPPRPRASAMVDPRIGDLGPALLALEDGTIFDGVAFGAPVAGGGGRGAGGGGAWAARRDRGLRPQGQHRAQPPAPRRARPRAAPYRHGRRCALERRCRCGALTRARRSGAARRPRGAGAGRDRRRPTAARDLPRPPGRRPCGGRGHAPTSVRPPRREPPGPRSRHGLRAGDRSEPRGPGRGRDAAPEWRLPGEPGQPERRLCGGPAPRRAAHRDGPVPPRGRAGPARCARGLRPVRRGVLVSRPASVLIIGSGPVVIGQAAEFDYAGTQACRALRAEGVRTILVNSNPATIMTDPQVADAIYLEPLTVEAVEAVNATEKPEGLLAGLGARTALNPTAAIAAAGVLG